MVTSVFWMRRNYGFSETVRWYWEVRIKMEFLKMRCRAAMFVIALLRVKDLV